jgi:hypothetical protein
MKSRFAFILILALMLVALPATKSVALEDFSFGVPSDNPETTKMEFEQWLRQRLTTAMSPFLSNSKILITVKVTLQPETKPKMKKADVFLSKFDTHDVLEYDPHADERKPKTFLQKVKKIDIALAHDGSLSQETAANLKTLAENLVAGVSSSRIKISTLAIAPAKVDSSPETNGERQVANVTSPNGAGAPVVRQSGVPMAHSPNYSPSQSNDSSLLQEISNFQILIASLLVSSVFGGILLSVLRGRKNSESAPQAPRLTPEAPAAPHRMNFANVNGLRARETALGQKMGRWMIELSPEQLARLTREDIKFGIALCHVAGEDRASAVTAGMSADLIEAVTQALLIWRFDQLEVFAGKFVEMVSHELARDPHEVTTNDFVREAAPPKRTSQDAGSEIVVESEEEGHGLPPAEFLFSLPAPILKASFARLSNADKLGLVLNLDAEKRADFISYAAPFGSKLRDYLDLELEEIQKDPDRSENVRVNRDMYLLAFSRACRELLSTDEAFREQVLPLWTEWRQTRTSGHAA